jgi:hypothetical protein
MMVVYKDKVVSVRGSGDRAPPFLIEVTVLLAALLKFYHSLKQSERKTAVCIHPTGPSAVTSQNTEVGTRSMIHVFTRARGTKELLTVMWSVNSVA